MDEQLNDDVITAIVQVMDLPNTARFASTCKRMREVLYRIFSLRLVSDYSLFVQRFGAPKNTIRTYASCKSQSCLRLFYNTSGITYSPDHLSCSCSVHYHSNVLTESPILRGPFFLEFELENFNCNRSFIGITFDKNTYKQCMCYRSSDDIGIGILPITSKIISRLPKDGPKITTHRNFGNLSSDIEEPYEDCDDVSEEEEQTIEELEWDLSEISISSGDCIGIQVNKKFDCVTFFLNRHELKSVTFPRKKEIWPTVEIHGGESIKIHPCGKCTKDL